MTDMEIRDHALAEMIRNHNEKNKVLAAQAAKVAEEANRRAEAARNYRFDTTQIEKAVAAVKNLNL